MPLMSTWPRMTRRGKSVGVTNFFEALGKLCDKSHPQRTLGFQVLPIRSWKHDPLPSEFSNGYICLGCAMSCAEIQWPYVKMQLYILCKILKIKYCTTFQTLTLIAIFFNTGIPLLIV